MKIVLKKLVSRETSILSARSIRRDQYGAINILAAGHAVLACGGMLLSGHPVKQEPAEASTRGFALV